MKVSDINLDIVKQYLRLEIDESNPLEALELTAYLDAAKSYVCAYTELSLDEVNELDYLAPPVLLLISDMYENKTMEGSKVVNNTFKSLINLDKSVNL